MILFFLLFIACRSKTIYSELYSIHSPDQNWNAVEAGGADYAWYNKDLGAIIYIDSNCDKQFSDRQLRDSKTSLLAGLAIGKPLSEQELFIDGREALMSIHKARLDGVDIHLATTVLSKNHCLYDFVYIAPPHRFNYGLQTFSSVIYSFSTKDQSIFTNKKREKK